ncbi:hypothetical protein MRX96_054426 [Rhipicephalus microplus]
MPPPTSSLPSAPLSTRSPPFTPPSIPSPMPPSSPLPPPAPHRESEENSETEDYEARSPPSASHRESEEDSDMEEDNVEIDDKQSPPVDHETEGNQNVENCSSELSQPSSSSPQPAGGSMSPV